jgi:hypothetical protein
VFRFPENIDPWNLVQVQRPRTDLPEQMFGPDGRLRRRDGFRLTDARWNNRENLSEIHYCVLCHERDKDSCSKASRSRRRDRWRPSRCRRSRQRPGHRAERVSARREDFEMHLLRKQGDAIGRSP